MKPEHWKRRGSRTINKEYLVGAAISNVLAYLRVYLTSGISEQIH